MDKVTELELTIKDLEARLHGVVDMLIQCENKLNQTRLERDYWLGEYMSDSTNDPQELENEDNWELHHLDGYSNYANRKRERL